MPINLALKPAVRKSDAPSASIIPFPEADALDALKWAKAYLSLPPDERRRVYFRGRLAGRSATEAFKRPLLPRSAGAGTAHSGAEEAYVEATVERILDKLRHCPPNSQDTTMNTVAFQLNRLLAGNWPGLTEYGLKSRFLDACRTLVNRKSPKGDWKPSHYEEKWRNAKRDATANPKPWPPPTFKGASNGDGINWRKLGMEMLREAQPLADTLGERYFRETRGVDPDRAEEYLFFHPEAICPELGMDKTMPAILAAYRTSPDGEPIAAHVTYVGTNGSKPGLATRKKTFGRYSGTGAALYLMPVGEVTAVAEGVEKALAINNAFDLPVIASGGKGAMKNMLVAAGIEELIICGDGGAEAEAKALARRAHAAGVKASICYPPVEGKDWDECTPEGIRASVLSALQWEPDPEEVPDGELPPGVYIDTGEALTPPEYLVKGMVPRRGTGLVIGQRGAGKTAIAIACGTAVAAGQSFFGHKVKQAYGVIYFAAEGVGQIRQRMRAAKMQLGIEGEIPFACIEAPRFNLSDVEEDSDQRAAFIKRCNETAAHLEARFGVKACLLFIDTAIKAYDIEDENDNAEIAAICKSLAYIGDETGCFTFGVVHAGKNMAAGARGASAWLDNVDIGLFVSGDRDEVKGTCENRALSQTKNRDGYEGPISSFDLKFIELGTDADGEPFGAMAIETNDRPVATDAKRKPTDAEIIFEKAFNELAIRQPHRIAVGSFKLMAFTQDTLREEFYRLYVPGKEGGEEPNMGAKRAAWHRALKSVFLLSRYPRENRDGVGWIWSIDEQREAWNAKERNEREQLREAAF